MNNSIKKALVVAMALAMAASTNLSVLAARPADATVSPVKTVISTSNFVEMEARTYFTDYVSANVPAADLLKRIAAEEKMVVIDIRDAVDYEKGHVKGAVNIPYGSPIVENLERIPNNCPVLVYCYSGQTASQTAAILRMAGKDAYNVSGGWNNGISKAEGIEELTCTEIEKLPRGFYNVANSMIDAAKDYYELALKNGKFNISNTAAQSMIANDEVFLLDVRSEKDHKTSWIEGVDKNIPFGEGMADQFHTLPRNKKILVQCYSGQTASQTVAVLRMLGFDAWTLSGGTNGWVNAKLPMVKA